MSRFTLSLLIFVLIVNSALSQLAQRFKGNNIELEPTADNKYHLIIRHSDGTMIELFVEKTDIGKFEVKGRLEQATYIRYAKHGVRTDSASSARLADDTAADFVMERPI
ncbi:uncharacterized protein LOC116805756 [Drosophila grimshawi]|uniref:uncharacterized protein LOC116805756 n=1 Tax=Drosophila grimshawi TaxID=7222 RepID=UPI000C871472|nr:uncharacterized protein LOC116805756 [Drosophila grimshawi]